MAHKEQRLLYHFVWTTWNRLPLLEGQVEERIHSAIRHHCGRMSVVVHAIGGMADHVHLLAALPSTVCVDDFIRAVKDESSRVSQRSFGSAITAFRWQLGFSVDTVSPSHRSKVRDYVLGQKDLHACGELWRGCEPRSTPSRPSAMQ